MGFSVFSHLAPFAFHMTPLDRYPPFLCRAAARDASRTRAMTVHEIAVASGLNERTIKRLSNRVSWSGVDVDVAFRFAAACGIDLLKLPQISRRKVTWTNRLALRPDLIVQWELQRDRQGNHDAAGLGG